MYEKRRPVSILGDFFPGIGNARYRKSGFTGKAVLIIMPVYGPWGKHWRFSKRSQQTEMIAIFTPAVVIVAVTQPILVVSRIMRTFGFMKVCK